MDFLTTEPGRIISMILIVVITFWLSAQLKNLLYRLRFKILKSKNIEVHGSFFILTSVIQVSIILLGVSYAVSLDPSVKSLSTSLLASAGLTAAIVGFAAKDVLSNFVSGAIIIIFRPFTITHWIKVEDVHEGWVEEIKLLYTVVKDERNKRMIIPNSEILSKNLINSSYRNKTVGEFIDFNIAYDSDITLAKNIIGEVASNDPTCVHNPSLMKLEEGAQKVEVEIEKFGEYAIVLRALVWLEKPGEVMRMRWRINQQVFDRFKKEGITIPYPSRNVIIQDSSRKRTQ